MNGDLPAASVCALYTPPAIADRSSGAGRKGTLLSAPEGGPDGQIDGQDLRIVLLRIERSDADWLLRRRFEKSSCNLVGVWFGTLGVSCVGSCVREPKEFGHRFTKRSDGKRVVRRYPGADIGAARSGPLRISLR